VQARGQRQVTAGEREHGAGDVLREHLLLQQGALGVVGAELVLGHAVDRGALRAPAAGEDAGTAHHAVRIDPVDPDAVRPKLGGQQPDLMGLIGLGRAADPGG
jgi:hypothetical protein